MALSDPASLSQTATTDAELAATARRASFAATAGTAVEYYDFTLYALMATTVARLFFPAENHVAALLSTLAIFAAGYMARPIGGLIFGRLGDRIGRRKILVVTVTMMGVATTLTGLLPTFTTIGIAAPVLMALLRVLQGVAAGGEIGGAATLVAESVPRKRRGLFGAATPAGAMLGTTLAAVSVGLFSLLGKSTMTDWGWRLPFLTAFPLLVLSLVYRLRIEESPLFQKLLVQHAPTKAPLTDLLASHKTSVLYITAITFASGCASLVSIYLPVHLSELGYSLSSATWIIAACPAITLVALSFAGRLADRWGRRKVIAVGFIGLDVLAVPCFFAMEQHNVALALFAGLILNVPYGFVQGPVFTLFAEQFPSRVRYTGISLGFNIGSVIGAGPSALVATWLIGATGLTLSPSFYVIFGSIFALATLVVIRDKNQAALS